MLCPHNNEDRDNPGCRHGGCQGRRPARFFLCAAMTNSLYSLAKMIFSDGHPTQEDHHASAGLKEPRGSAALVRRFCFYAPALAFLCMIGTAWGEELPILPDDALTPGAVASTDETEVCATGPNGTYSQQHRQTSEAMKAAVFKRYGIDKATAGEVEVDHRGPLCAGFADDIRNLWIQPGNGHGTHWTFHLKDAVEALACRQICSGKVSLEEAQSWFLAPDWRTAYCAHFTDPACGTLATQ